MKISNTEAAFSEWDVNPAPLSFYCSVQALKKNMIADFSDLTGNLSWWRREIKWHSHDFTDGKFITR